MGVANVITAGRIACALALALCPTFSAWFYVFYLVGGVSDVLDGLAARRFGGATELGTRLDTAADFVFVLTVGSKVARAVYLPRWLVIWAACIAVIKCGSMIGGYIIYKRFLSEHTVMNKVCGVLLFALPLCIGRFPRQAVAVLTLLSCGAAALAALQEGVYILTGREIR